ncbi:ATP-binding protein [Candidatus Omnitrophota bacterium]
MNTLYIHFIVSLWLTALTTLSLGAFVLVINRKNIVNKTFAFYSFSISWWSFCQIWLIACDTRIAALMWTRIEQVGVFFIPTLFVHFVISLLNIKGKGRLLKASYCASLLFALLCPTRFMMADAIPKAAIPYVKQFATPGLAYHFAIVYFLFMVGYGLSKLYAEYRVSTGARRNQFKYLFCSSFLGYVGGGANFLLVYGKSIPYVNPLGTYTLPIYIVVLAYAIFRYRLLDINIAITRFGIFVFVYLVVLGLPFSIGYKLSKIGLWYIPLLVSTVLASLGPYAYSLIRTRAENQLRKEEFHAHQLLSSLAQNMTRFTKLELLLKLIAHQVVKIMKVTSAAIYLKNQNGDLYVMGSAWNLGRGKLGPNELSEDSALIVDMRLRGAPIVAEELKLNQGSATLSTQHVSKLQAELKQLKTALLIPALKGDALFGFLALGQKRDSGLFTQDDLNLLLLLANQAVLAIENAQLFESEQKLLAEKSRRSALADMAPGVSHQFNNRLMSITAAAELQDALLDQLDLKKIDKKAASAITQAKDAFKAIIGDAVKGRDIAKAILKKGKAKIEFLKQDIEPVVQGAVDIFKMSKTRSSLAGAQEPRILLDIDKGLPQLNLSESLIQDIFYNLIDNARDAITIKTQEIKKGKIVPEDTSYKGHIIIKVIKKADAIVITVQDNGIGIKEEDKKKLFVPYFTTKGTYTKGTGLGLWTIRGFIEDHKGKLAVESDYTKGTKFTITLPGTSKK